MILHILLDYFFLEKNYFEVMSDSRIELQNSVRGSFRTSVFNWGISFLQWVPLMYSTLGFSNMVNAEKKYRWTSPRIERVLFFCFISFSCSYFSSWLCLWEQLSSVICRKSPPDPEEIFQWASLENILAFNFISAEGVSSSKLPKRGESLTSKWPYRIKLDWHYTCPKLPEILTAEETKLMD